MKKAFALICALLLCPSCQPQEVVISQVRIAGNKRIPTETIRAQIQTQSGEPLSDARISADIQRIRALDEFDDVQIKDDVSLNGDHVLTFFVWEKFPKAQ
jgi:outer membrane protein assembly factor BamA